jgi:hypothetical protein
VEVVTHGIGAGTRLVRHGDSKQKDPPRDAGGLRVGRDRRARG